MSPSNLLWVEHCLNRIGYSHNSFSPDSQTLASATADDSGFEDNVTPVDPTIKLWNRDGKLLKSLKGHQKAVWAISFSPDGQIIASGSADNTVRLWSRKGNPLRILRGHSDRVNSIDFSRHGDILASSSNDQTVKLWNLEGNLQEAIEDYNHVIHLNPKDIDAYFYRGIAYYRLKEYKKAIADYTKAIELNLEEAEIYFVRGLARYESSDLEGAIVDTTLALQLKLDSGYWFQRPYLIRGLAIAALGNRKAAEDDYRSFLPNPGEIDYLSLCEMFYEECPGGGGVFHTALGREANKQAAGRRRHK